MNTLIVYASKYGLTADCAKKVKEGLKGEVTLQDINAVKQPLSLAEYDTVLIGGSVYIGKIAKNLRAFCINNLAELENKQIGIFLCCAMTEQVADILKANFPAPLLAHAKVIKMFGCEARLDKMSFLDKKIIGAVTKGDYSKFKVLEGNIEKFIAKINDQ